MELNLALYCSEGGRKDDDDLTQVTEQDYSRAERILSLRERKLILNTLIEPNWTDNGRFWYRRETKQGKEFILVDPDTNVTQTAFDHTKLAEAFSRAAGTRYKHNELPFDSFRLLRGNSLIQFETGNVQWVCDLDSYECRVAARYEVVSEDELISPDGRWASFVRDCNVYVRSLVRDEEIRLTNDGQPYWNYGTSPESNTTTVTDRIRCKKRPPVVLWSPDSRRLATHKLDQRKVKCLHLIQSLPDSNQDVRPKLHSYRYPLVGDNDLATADLIVLDLQKKTSVTARCERELVAYRTPIELQRVWWNENCLRLYYIYKGRADKLLRLYEVNAETGEARTLQEESGETQIEPNLIAEPFANLDSRPNVHVLHTGEVIWFSERDGWAHLYLYDGTTGALKRQLTSGEWVVREVLHVDEKTRKLYFTAGGREENRDPYYRHLYQLDLDTGSSSIRLLTPEDAEHYIRFSPAGRHFVDTYSIVSTAPVSVLRSSNGTLVRVLEEADIEGLVAGGWIRPEPFSAKARDGVTDIYGVIYRPSHFDPSRKYPIVDDVYPGPNVIRSAKSFDPDPENRSWFWHPQAIAELGFIVVTIDGMGTPLRSKAFHDISYGKLEEAGGLEDHVIALKQLAKRYPYMDLGRVGVYGHSGGGYASARAIMSYPDFYQVAVSSAGNHDVLGYLADWGEKYQGPPKHDNYLNQANSTIAHNLKGRLLLVYGSMDENVHPALTLQLVDALIRANKNFDLLVMPDRSHDFSTDPYFLRRRWDYFVRHLLLAEPPDDYKIGRWLDTERTVEHHQA